MDASTDYVESEYDGPDNLGSMIGNTLSEVLHIKDDPQEKHASNNVDGSDEEDNAGEKLSKLSGNSSESIHSNESPENVSSLSISLQTPGKLISAIKGSHEKEGIPPKKLTVNWAPDVYDPPPTDLEALLTKGTKQQKVPKKEKKAGKKQQNGKDFSQVASSAKEPSKGGGKDKKKKQHRGAVGRSRNYDMFDDDGGQGLFSGSIEEDSYSNKGSSNWDSGEKKSLKVGFVRSYDLPPSEDDSEDGDEDEGGAAASNGKFSSGGKKDKQSHGNLGKQRCYDMPPEEDDGEEVEKSNHGKFSSGGKKSKQSHGNLGKQRCYDMPPEDDDEEEEEEEEVKKSKHGSSFPKRSLKEVHHSIAKVR